MNKHDLRARFHRLFHSTWFSLLFLLVLVAGLATLAYYVTVSYTHLTLPTTPYV